MVRKSLDYYPIPKRQDGYGDGYGDGYVPYDTEIDVSALIARRGKMFENVLKKQNCGVNHICLPYFGIASRAAKGDFSYKQEIEDYIAKLNKEKEKK